MNSEHPDYERLRAAFAQSDKFETGLMDYSALLEHMCNRSDLDPAHSTIEALSQDVYLLHPRRHAGVSHGQPILYFDETKYELLESRPVNQFGDWGYVHLEADRLAAMREKGPQELLRVLPNVVLGPQYAHPEENLAGMLCEAKLAIS